MVNMGIEDKTVSVIEIRYKNKCYDSIITTPEIADKIFNGLNTQIPILFKGVEIIRNDIIPENSLTFTVKRLISKVYRAYNSEE